MTPAQLAAALAELMADDDTRSSIEVTEEILAVLRFRKVSAAVDAAILNERK